MSKRITVASVGVATTLVAAWSTTGQAAQGNSIPERLGRIEATLTELLGLVPPPPPEPTAYNRTRLLIPFVTNQAGFDTGVAIVNTGLDSTGAGRFGRRVQHPLLRRACTNGAPVAASETTNRAVAAGETITFVLSSGGSAGMRGNAELPGIPRNRLRIPVRPRLLVRHRRARSARRAWRRVRLRSCCRASAPTPRSRDWANSDQRLERGAVCAPLDQTTCLEDAAVDLDGLRDLASTRERPSCATLDACFTPGARGRRWTRASRSSGP